MRREGETEKGRERQRKEERDRKGEGEGEKRKDVIIQSSKVAFHQREDHGNVMHVMQGPESQCHYGSFPAPVARLE